MLCFQLTPKLCLAAAFLLMVTVVSAAQQPTVMSTHKVTTCACVHRLSCTHGVIAVQSALYGRADGTTCSEGRPDGQLSDTDCAQDGTLEIVKRSCDGRRECEIHKRDVQVTDPCFGTYKYLETTYACVSATQSVTCEHSVAHLKCDEGQLIQVFGADYGRHDQTTCSVGQPASQLRNVACTSPASASQVAAMCNGKNSCVIQASNSVFGDPCYGTYKYLEVSYDCHYGSESQ